MRGKVMSASQSKNKKSNPGKRNNDIPPQHQAKQPGEEEKMKPKPEYDDKSYKGSAKLEGKAALIRSEERRVGKECRNRRRRAEDGIRDFHVTGVQTCALPI